LIPKLDYPKDWLAVVDLRVTLLYSLFATPWQVGPGGRGWVPTVKGYSEPTSTTTTTTSIEEQYDRYDKLGHIR